MNTLVLDLCVAWFADTSSGLINVLLYFIRWARIVCWFNAYVVLSKYFRIWAYTISIKIFYKPIFTRTKAFSIFLSPYLTTQTIMRIRSFTRQTVPMTFLTNNILIIHIIIIPNSWTLTKPIASKHSLGLQ